MSEEEDDGFVAFEEEPGECGHGFPALVFCLTTLQHRRSGEQQQRQ